MGNQSFTKWTLENVLFLDPSLQITEKKLIQNNIQQEINTKTLQEEKKVTERRTIKRNIPDQRALQSKYFLVTITTNQSSAEFYIQCVNKPDVALVICNRSKIILRTILLNLIVDITRHHLTINCQYKSSPNSAVSRIIFTFTENESIQEFVDIAKLMFGIYVPTYGITRQNDNEVATKVLEKVDEANKCLIHGINACKCNTRAPKLTMNVKKEEYISSKYPITIVGKMESGVTLSWNDIKPLDVEPTGVIVVWKIATYPGFNCQFEDEMSTDPNLVSYEDTLRLTNMMVGKIIQVKVTRGINVAKNEVFYSLSQRGPVTVNDEEAKNILEIYCSNKTISVEIFISCISKLWPDEISSDLHYLAPFYRGTISLSNQGLLINLTILEKDYHKEFQWNDFYPSREYAYDQNYEKNLFIYINYIDDDNNEQKIGLALSNYEERNALYHAIFFYKLQPNQRETDRWLRDLQNNYFSVFKKKYSKLWQRTDYLADILTLI